MRERASPDLFARLPGHLQSRDAEAGHALEALMGVLRSELRHVEQDLDQLYDNWFVETCEPWVLPYIADLLGARPMREIGADQAGLLRAYVANIHQYRQAKGTAAVLEQAARDVSGWACVAVEFFQRLATSQHVNHLRADAPAFADLRQPGIADSRGPFSPQAHAPAAGAPDGWAGRYNIPHLGLFVWTRPAMPLWPVASGAPGAQGGPVAHRDAGAPTRLRFDPLGRDLALVNRPRADTTLAGRVDPGMVPAPLRREAIHAALNAARQTGTTPDHWFETAPPFRVRLDGVDLPPARLHGCDLSADASGQWRAPATPGEVLVDPELGRLSLHPDDAGKSVETGFAVARGFDIGGGAYDRRDSLALWQSDLFIPGEAPPWRIGVSKIAGSVIAGPVTDDPELAVVTTLREAVGQWNAQAGPGARGLIVVLDNASYDEALHGVRSVILPPGARLAIVAAAWVAGPTGSARLSPVHRRPVLRGPILVEGQEAGEAGAGELILDGLVVGDRIEARAGGDLGALRLYNCTVGFRDGRLDRPVTSGGANARLSLTLYRSILGAIALPEATGPLTITRSILGEDRSADASGAGALLFNAPGMDAQIADSTLLGGLTCRTLHAENTLLAGRVEVAHRQTGCVRFSWAAPGSALPRCYRCQPEPGSSPPPHPVFASTRFDDPGFARLRLSTPAAILEGAEDGMEMGAGHADRAPARRANIADAMQDFAPLGLTPGIIYMD